MRHASRGAMPVLLCLLLVACAQAAPAGTQSARQEPPAASAPAAAPGTHKQITIGVFRDTFAVELLLSGVPIDQVSLLLGHSSVKVTEKHYSPFVKARQEQLENSVKLSWQVHREWLNRSAPPAVHIN